MADLVLWTFDLCAFEAGGGGDLLTANQRCKFPRMGDKVRELSVSISGVVGSWVPSLVTT